MLEKIVNEGVELKHTVDDKTLIYLIVGLFVAMFLALFLNKLIF